MKRAQTFALILTAFFTSATATLFAATSQTEHPSVVVMAGQTIEIPVRNVRPLAGDLAARGAFESGDVTFTDGPGCHLATHGCTLMITAAPTSKRYSAVRVKVTNSAAANTPVFTLSVIHPGDTAPVTNGRAEIVFTPRRLSSKVAVPPAPTTAATKHLGQLPQRSGNALFFAVAQPRPGLAATGKRLGRFTPETNGPSYQIVELTNQDAAQSLSVTLTGSGAGSFTLAETAAFFGANQNCASLTRIGSGESCLVIVKGEVGDPSQAPQTATLTLRGENGNAASFTLTDTTYVYAAGGFDTLGNANVSGGNLLAQCTAGTCSNALQGSTGNNYSESNFSVGDWINALSITPAGNLLVGGVFGTIGGATSGASSGTAALLAQCTPGSVAGNACINQINTGATANPNAFNNAYINGIASSHAGSSFIYLAGDFANIRSSSVPSGKALARCSYSGTSANQTCSLFLSGAATKYANSTVVGIDYFDSKLVVGGLFTQVAGYPSSAPVSGTTFASCTTSACSSGMDSNNPNNSVLAITNDGTSLYMGGTFTQAGGYSSSGGYPLVACTVGSPTTCSNALSGSNEADSYIEGLTHSGGSLYVGGKFTTIGGATPVGSGNMLAVCTIGGTCSNFVTDTSPYATGSDWSGIISAVALGTQTSIAAN